MPFVRTAALAAYEAERMPAVGRFQSAAQTSLEWFENAGRHAKALDPLTFAFSLMTRSKRITYDNLATRDPELLQHLRDQGEKVKIALSTRESAEFRLDLPARGLSKARTFTRAEFEKQLPLYERILLSVRPVAAK